MPFSFSASTHPKLPRRLIFAQTLPAMKQAIVPFLALAALLAGLFALYRSYEAKPSQGSPEAIAPAQPEKKEEEAHEHGHEELAEYMMRLQWYANKLYFAGEAGNQPLADFYLHEIEEVMEEVVKAGIVDEGVQVSEHMKAYGLSYAEDFLDELRAEGLGNFGERYSGLIANCNSCHTVTEHSYIKIITPTTPVVSNQDFMP